jgi:hypothetical protein
MTTAALQWTRFAGRRLTRTLFAATALVLLVASVAPAAEPAVVISVKSFDELLADVAYLGEVVNQPQFGGLAQALIGQMTGGQGLKGLDGSKPIGAYVTLSPEGQPKDIVVFVPVSDQKEFAATLAMLSPNAEKVGELTQYQFLGNPNPILGKGGAKHFFFSPTAESLKETADPAKLVTVPADISIEVDLTKIPDSFKEAFLTQVEVGGRANAQNNPSEGESERRGRETGFNVALAGTRRLTVDAARLTLTLDINAKTKAAVLDLAFATKPGTALAKACAGYAKTESPFTGLISRQTVGGYVTSAPLSTEVEAMFNVIVEEGHKGGLSNLPADPAAKEKATQMLKRFAELASSTIQRGRLDQAVVVNAVGGKLQVVGAMKVARGDQVGQALEDFVKNTPVAKAHVKLNVAQIGKAKVHTITLPPDEDAQNYFGTGPVHLAINDDTAVAVLGGDALATLKGVLDRSAAPAAAARAPISIRIGISKILELINHFNPLQIPPAVLEQSQSALEGGLDQVALEISGKPDVLKIRLEVQEGVLRLGAVAATQN